jgi:hypothetical protein
MGFVEALGDEGRDAVKARNRHRQQLPDLLNSAADPSRRQSSAILYDDVHSVPIQVSIGNGQLSCPFRSWAIAIAFSSGSLVQKTLFAMPAEVVSICTSDTATSRAHARTWSGTGQS